MALRIVNGLGIAPYQSKQYLDNKLSVNRPYIVELKYYYMLKEFFSVDGASILISIMDKFNIYFEQPAMHASTLSGNEGILLTQVLLPAVKIFNALICMVIQERNTDFKDTTPIEVLLKTYALMYYVPKQATCYRIADNIKKEIIKTVLAYTQSYPIDGIDTKTIHNSLWTHMISELIKFILIGPHYFIPGLMIFSEILPLSLPLATAKQINDEQIQQLITKRQLWSAHLHSQSKILIEMIQNMCASSYKPLLIQLNRVCLQLSDLAPNVSLLVAKAILDLIPNEQMMNEITASYLARLFGLLANLTNQSSIKVSILALMNGKLLETVGKFFRECSMFQIVQKNCKKNHFHTNFQRGVENFE
jgi:protein virilizer